MNNTIMVEDEKLRLLLNVIIIDDAFDTLSEVAIKDGEREEIWSLILEKEELLELFHDHGFTLDRAEQIDGSFVTVFDQLCNDNATLKTIWTKSGFGRRIDTNRQPVLRLEQLLNDRFTFQSVAKYGQKVTGREIVEQGCNLCFLDWRLGDHDPIGTAIRRVEDIRSAWPDDKPKPIIVLMSSDHDLRKRADDFFRQSGLLRGMCYAIPKNELIDPFTLSLYVQQFEMSLPAGHILQDFNDVLAKQLKKVTNQFVEQVRELTLSDYSYIQSLCLKWDGQPLGEYLRWFFGASLGQLLFSESLQSELQKLDQLEFANALPRTIPPSGRLATLHQSALFDKSVGDVDTHALKNDAEESSGNLVLSFGDVFACKSDEEKPDVPHLYLVLNPQCDLIFTADPNIRSMKAKSILLVGGQLESILETGTPSSLPRTELYIDDGKKYRIIWDIWHIKSVASKEFTKWKEDNKFERVARLHLPSALEIQRAFITSLSRIGVPVMPPAYQVVPVQIFFPPIADPIKRVTGIGEDEVVVLLLTKYKNKIKQQCALTLPLVKRLKRILEGRKKDLEEKRLADNARANQSINNQIASIEMIMTQDVNWLELMSPFDLPKQNKSKSFLRNKLQVVRGKEPSQIFQSNHKLVMAVILEPGSLNP